MFPVHNVYLTRQAAVTSKMLVSFGVWKNKQCTIAQLSFKRIHHNNLPSNKSILEWRTDFIERECICVQRKGHLSRLAVSENVVETIILAAPRSRRADVAKSYDFRNAWGLHLISCNWSKSYIRETKKRALNFTKLFRNRWS
ncbi:hypothetical protein PoB_005340900 [Plakobranchus ocellatus]|uniref:Uncharacterized protein n=1 Tax=Plakobranchus ocellatus TaxID=259542 RepID=A0AAV4C759_9GAST|nr:hypothetical protein PoB_005340900 [Plakobranchus ocellatus]